MHYTHHTLRLFSSLCKASRGPALAELRISMIPAVPGCEARARCNMIGGQVSLFMPDFNGSQWTFRCFSWLLLVLQVNLKWFLSDKRCLFKRALGAFSLGDPAARGARRARDLGHRPTVGHGLLRGLQATAAREGAEEEEGQRGPRPASRGVYVALPWFYARFMLVSVCVWWF